MTQRILDSHFHIWNLDRQNLPWLDGLDSITRSYTTTDLVQAYRDFSESTGTELDVLGGVYVEVDGDDPILEDEIIYGLDDPFILGTVMRSRVAPDMRAPVQSDGIREPLHIDEQPRGRCLEPSFIAGLRVLGDAGLPFDVCVRVDELGDVVEAATQVPDTTLVIDHLGNVESLTDDYRQAMSALADLPNVVVKVSGFATADQGLVDEILTFIKDTFPTDRLMYASNFPVVDLYSTFNEHLSAVLRHFGGDDDVLVNTAARVYGIQLEG